MTYIHEVECQMRALNVCSELSGPLKDPNVDLNCFEASPPPRPDSEVKIGLKTNF